MLSDLEFSITSKLWRYKGGKSSWYFVTVPEEESRQIKFFANDGLRRGWGSVKVNVTVGGTHWQTSIFPDSKKGVYLLPVKKEIRQKEKLSEGDDVNLDIKVLFHC